jgi:hypothetical protein
MQSSQNLPYEAMSSNPKARRRFGLKSLVVLLLLIGAGSAAAFHFLKKPPRRAPPVEYKEPDVAQAVAEVQKAKTQRELDQDALALAETEMKTVQAEWEAAKLAKEQAGSNTQELANAETQFAKAAEKLDAAKAKLKTALDKLKTAEELLAEKNAERERAEKQLAQEAARRRALLGKWKRSDYYGGLTLELREDGLGLMVIDFNTLFSFTVGTDRLEVDIQWKVANGDHVIFDSVRGRPEKAFDFVSKEKGNRRDQVLRQIDETSFTTHDADNESKIKTWTRIPGE